MPATSMPATLATATPATSTPVTCAIVTCATVTSATVTSATVGASTCPAPPRSMTTTRRDGIEETPSVAPARGAMGLSMMAAVLMMLSGAWNILEGLAAVLRGSPFPALPGYVYSLSVTGWGWFHLITGAVVFLVGAALITDNRIARAAGVLVAALSAIINFLFIPYLGFTAWWSIAVIALDIVIIWALLQPRHRRAW